MNLGLRFVLGVEGVNDTEAAVIDASLPSFARLSADVRELDPILRRIYPDAQKAFAIIAAAYVQLMPLLKKNQPDLEKLFPIMLQGYPDFVAVMPAFEILLKLAEGPKP